MNLFNFNQGHAGYFLCMIFQYQCLGSKNWEKHWVRKISVYSVRTIFIQAGPALTIGMSALQTISQERSPTAEGSGFYLTCWDIRDHKYFCILEPMISHPVIWYYELSEIWWWLVIKSFIGEEKDLKFCTGFYTEKYDLLPGNNVWTIFFMECICFLQYHYI